MKIEWVSRPCPLCGSTDESSLLAEAALDTERLDNFAFASRKVPEYMHYRLVSCLACDLVYANPVPTPGTLLKAYREASFDSSEESRFAGRTYGRFLPEILKRLPDCETAVDIGAGDGAFLNELLARGFSNVIGLEPSEAPRAAAKDAIRPLLRAGELQDQDLKDGSLSLITCFQVLEHISDPLGMCRNAYRLLKKGGAFFFICHDRRGLFTRMLGMKSPIYDIEHLQLFSENSATHLLSRCGFQDITVRRVTNRYPLHYWLKLFPLPLALKRPSLSFLKAAKVGYWPISLPAGNIAVIGYK